MGEYWGVAACCTFPFLRRLMGADSVGSQARGGVCEYDRLVEAITKAIMTLNMHEKMK